MRGRGWGSGRPIPGPVSPRWMTAFGILSSHDPSPGASWDPSSAFLSTLLLLQALPFSSCSPEQDSHQPYLPPHLTPAPPPALPLDLSHPTFPSAKPLGGCRSSNRTKGMACQVPEQWFLQEGTDQGYCLPQSLWLPGVPLICDPLPALCSSPGDMMTRQEKSMS